MTPEEIREAAIEVVMDHLLDGPEYQAIYDYAEEEEWAERDTQSVIGVVREICDELREALA